MKHNHIKRFLSTVLLLAFTAPSGISYPSYGGYNRTNTYSAEVHTSLNPDSKLSHRNDRITLSLRDSDVRQVLRMFADKAGKNIVFHSSVSGKVTLDLVDMPLNDAFNLVLQISNLNFYLRGNTVIVISKNSTDNANFSKQEMMTFPVNYVSAAKIADFLNRNVFGMKKIGMSGVDAATVNAATNEVIVFGMPSDAQIVKKVIAQLDKQPQTNTFIVNHTTPAEMADMVCNLLLPAHGAGGKGGSGGDSGYVPPTPGVGTGLAATITGGAADSSDSSSTGIKLGEGVVACSVNQSASGTVSPFDMQNLAVAYYPQRGSIVMIGGSEAQVRMVQDFIRTNDIKQPQAYLELSIVELTEEGSKQFQNNWSIQSKDWGFQFNNGKTSGGREGGPLQRYSPVVRHRWYTDQTTGKTTYEEVAGKEQIIKGSSYVSWTMNYLIENKKARVLANPKIVVTNGKESVIDLTEDYVEKVTSEFLSSSGTLTTGAVQKTYEIGEDKGIKITLTPFISPDGYVTLNIKPDYVTEAGKEYSIGATGDQEIAATLMNRRNLDLKNVRIKDGETLVLGGMIQEYESKVVQKIPVLGDLPLIGTIFKSTATVKSKGELVIMITPRIINDNDDNIADRL